MHLRSLIALTRLDKPIGVWLLFFPAGWSVALAATDTKQLVMLTFLMLIGAVITRSGGCIINDLTDRTLDRHVERTRNRPLASGAISVSQALIVLGILAIAALVLALSLPIRVFYLSLLAVPMIVAYPWMKRFTWWPQAFLGLTFNLSVMMGWAATGQPFTLTPLLLYAAAACWTLGYDTIYAVADLKDDAAIGVRSTARAVGKQGLVPFVTLCYTSMLLLLVGVGKVEQNGHLYYAGLMSIALQMVWQIRLLPHADPVKAIALFRSNQWVGLLFLATLLANRGG